MNTTRAEQANTILERMNKPIIGMVHVGALPGTPKAEYSVQRLADRAAKEAVTLTEAGFDAIILENMHDRPYLPKLVGPEIVSAMTRIGAAVRNAVTDPIGVQILAGANREAIAVAQAVDAQFIRTEGFVFSAVADEGFLGEADAGPLLRYRKSIGAESIEVWCDIKKKHSAHAITADLDLPAWARAAEFCGADAVIVTGDETGDPVEVESLAAVRESTSLPIVVGSGATPEQLPVLFEYADAVIVGSYLKHDGRWMNRLDEKRIQSFVSVAKKAR